MIINNQKFRTIWPNDGMAAGSRSVSIIDQTKLPHAFKIVEIINMSQMIVAIKTMQVRGAPLIGAAAAYGMALAMQDNCSEEHLQLSAKQLTQSRPTAVNLRWAVERMKQLLLPTPVELRLEAAWEEAAKICDEDVLLNQAIGQHGLNLIQRLHSQDLNKQHNRQLNILTHCNAGWLATVDFGTALAPIYAAYDAGVDVHVWVDETRPRNQGASLTAWELAQHGVPHTVISDNAGGHLMQHGQVDMVIVGADRVTSTGDVCNKIGTYLKALAAFDNHVPFYAAVPSPTIDWTMLNGVQEIEIEERDGREVAWVTGMLASGEVTEVNILPANTKVANPAFDVTPARLVTGIITEHGVFSPNQLRDILK
ncbi:S-methyl-5-thioribose-1-phosphate isomerase [Methylotenera versatilis]|uniref:Methylthioribose-1-phosphate isomerase n=1 Tax=Methylotenera versatilis (strain 301) TaxID=666681 RepID=D7DQ94_METV0|nr:S-methyl-5-thioribose-1-phosphate isomerase [Methylotenera versatilis]ADI29465.1 translation initiation factor, aIF-2BI family [Methylotenera versatilis 301]